MTNDRQSDRDGLRYDAVHRSRSAQARREVQEARRRERPILHALGVGCAGSLVALFALVCFWGCVFVLGQIVDLLGGMW
jgi:hypothetical protein